MTFRFRKSSVKTVHLNTRDAGFEHEMNDCAVKAIQAGTGVPYRDAHQFCKVVMQRPDRRGPETWDIVLRQFAREQSIIFGYRVFNVVLESRKKTVRRSIGVMYSPARDAYVRQIAEFTKPAYATITEFVRTHPTGRFLVASRNHAWAVIDGVVYDNGAAGPRTQVQSAYELKPSSECEGI